MFSPNNFGAAFGLVKIQEEYILSSRKPWKSSVHAFETKPYEQPVTPGYRSNKDLVALKRISSTDAWEEEKRSMLSL